MIKEFIAKRVFEASYKHISSWLSEKKAKLTVGTEKLESALNNHLEFVKNWSKSVSIKGMIRPRNIQSQYTGLDIQMSARKWSSKPIANEKLSVIDVISREYHSVILGRPGAGKTTTIKFVCDWLLFNEKSSSVTYSFPVVIQLRTLEDKEDLYSRLGKIFGIVIDFSALKDSLHDSDIRSLYTRVIDDYIRELCPIVLLDGLDELSPRQLDIILPQVRHLLLSHTNSKIVLTCRTGSYDYNLENSEVFEIDNFDQEKISQFAYKWFGEEKQAETFLRKLKESPYSDTSVSPLILTFLCSIFDRNKDIPDRPKHVYKRIVQLFIEEWDQQRMIYRISKYEGFDSLVKFDFLCALSFRLTTMYEVRSYRKGQIKSAYLQINNLFGLPVGHISKVVQEIEAHSGLILQSGYDSYEFCHKSIQEYLCAEFLVRTPGFSVEWIWRNNLSAEFAIAVSLAIDCTSYFNILVLTTFSKHRPSRLFMNEFLTRLAIEKPDFQMSTYLGIALIYIYDLVYAHDDEEKNSDQYFTFLKGLMKTKVIKDSIDEVKYYYYISYEGKYLMEMTYRNSDYKKTLEGVPKTLQFPNSRREFLY